MVAISASLLEHSWDKRFPDSASSRPPKAEQPARTVENTAQGESLLVKPRKRKRTPARDPSPPPQITDFKTTRSGRKVVPKRYKDEIVGDQATAVIVSVDDFEEEGADDAAAATGEEKAVQVLEHSGPDGEAANNGASMKVGIDDLFSVAEAIEKSQQPDFCDVSEWVAQIKGSATHKELVRDCLLCSKQLFGRHALSRHMRNVHPKVFGPYACPLAGCGKNVVDGIAFKNHLQNSHFGPRALAAARDGIYQIVFRTLSGFRYLCQQLVYTVLSRIFLIASKIGELLRSYQEYPAKSVGKQGG
jgi:hypothetical protein